MFLRDLTDDQKKAFLVLADKVVHADGNLAEEEKVLIAALTAEMGLASSVPADMDFASAAAAFSDRKSKVAVMLELIGIGHADGDFDKDETEIVKEIMRTFRITPVEFEIMSNWVLRQLALVREADELMTAEG